MKKCIFWISHSSQMRLPVINPNLRVCCASNPHAIYESSLHNEKIGLWFGVSYTSIVGPIDCFETVCGNILYAFISQVTENETVLRLLFLWHSWTLYWLTDLFISVKISKIFCLIFVSFVWWKTQIIKTTST